MLEPIVLVGCTLVSIVIATLPCTPAIPTAFLAPVAVACLVTTSPGGRRAHWFLFAALSVPFALAEPTATPQVLLIPGAIALVRIFMRSRPLGAITLLALLVDGRPLDRRDLPRSFASSSAFLAVAVGDIDPDEGHVQLDIWAIDEQKRLVNLSNDCTQ